MASGLALFQRGLVGERNIIATRAQSFVAIGVVSVVWVVAGYSVPRDVAG
jgi:ammonia channel protein AmtB